MRTSILHVLTAALVPAFDALGGIGGGSVKVELGLIRGDTSGDELRVVLASAPPSRSQGENTAFSSGATCPDLHESRDRGETRVGTQAASSMLACPRTRPARMNEGQPTCSAALRSATIVRPGAAGQFSRRRPNLTAALRPRVPRGDSAHQEPSTPDRGHHRAVGLAIQPSMEMRARHEQQFSGRLTWR